MSLQLSINSLDITSLAFHLSFFELDLFLCLLWPKYFFDQNCILIQNICVAIVSVFTVTVTVDLFTGAAEYSLIISMSVSLVSFSSVNYHFKQFVFTYGAPGDISVSSNRKQLWNWRGRNTFVVACLSYLFSALLISLQLLYDSRNITIDPFSCLWQSKSCLTLNPRN